MVARDDSPDLTVEIDENGQIDTSSRAARRRLAAAAGRWRLIPAAGELMIWQREQEEGRARPAISLAGDIDGPEAIVSVLNFVHFSQWEGALSVISGPVRKTLHFQKGALLSAASNVPEDRLGAMLVRFGHVTEEQLVSAVRDVTPQRRLGTILVERGLLATHDIYEGVRKQIEEIFYSLLLVRRGAFYFVKQLDQAALAARLHLDTQGLLLEGLRRIDELGYFRGKLPSADVVLTRRAPAPSGELAGVPRTVYQLVDGRRTLADIAREARLGEFAATKGAFELLQTGHIAVHEDAVRHDPVPDAALPADAAASIIDAYNGALARLWAALAARGKLPSLREGITAFLSGSVRFAHLLKDVTLADDGKLLRSRLLLNVDTLPDGDRLALLQSALSELLMFSLFIAGDAIDRREQEDLHTRVAKALERLPRAGTHSAL